MFFTYFRLVCFILILCFTKKNLYHETLEYLWFETERNLKSQNFLDL